MSKLTRWRRARLLSVVVALLLAACGTDGAEQDDPGDVLPTISLSEEAGLSHVHGLGINPADGQLYVATHFGLWEVDPRSGGAKRVGEHFLDLMGFTVVGDDHFLASGHPPLTDDLPAHLGLIETTDAGHTWRSVSLTGQRQISTRSVTRTAWSTGGTRSTRRSS